MLCHCRLLPVRSDAGPAIASIVRHLASSSTSPQSRHNIANNNNDNVTPPPSNRQAFKQVPIDPSIRRYIDMIGVGIPPSRGPRGTRKKRGHKNSSPENWLDQLDPGKRRPMGSSTKPPPPFSTGGNGSTQEQQQRRRVVVIGSVSRAQDTFPTNQEFIPEVVRTPFSWCCRGVSFTLFYVVPLPFCSKLWTGSIYFFYKLTFLLLF